MKALKTIGLAILYLLISLILILFLFFKQETYQMYKVVTFFDAANISENFKSVKDIFPTTTVPKPSNSKGFAKAENEIKLPTQFYVDDSLFLTTDYLDFVQTDALLILQHDTLVYEYYGNDFTENDHHISWSMSKSVISALFGIAIDEGNISSIEETVTDYLPEFKGTGYDDIRIKDVLQMSTGVGFNEDYGDFNSDINIMGRYFALGMPMADFAKTLKRDHEPGTYNHYVSINTQVLGMILTSATGRTITDYMNEKL